MEDAPKPEDFAPGAVRRAVLAETLQHPLTVLPAAVSAVSVLYMALLGGDPQAFAVALGAGLLATGSWVVNFVMRGETFARRHVERLKRRRGQSSRGVAEAIGRASADAGFERGAQQARELVQAHERLVDYLEGTLAGSKSPGVERLRVLADDTYREGLSILRKALEVHRALRAVDREKLERELSDWEQAADRRRREHGLAADAADARLASLDSNIAGHRRRLELYRARSDQIARLLAESEKLETALESTYLEIVDLKSPEPLFSRGDAASALERAVGAARRVEDRLRQGPQDADDDWMYQEAGRDGP